MKALSGFYYVLSDGETVRCRARGRFRKDGVTPLVGDYVAFTRSGDEGVVDFIEPRRNEFTRPPIANVDQLVLLAANVNPVTEPFLIDRMAAVAAHQGAETVVCINKCDLDMADELFRIYTSAGFRVIRTSAVTGMGLSELREALSGRISVLTGNSGVGKSSLLNALDGSLSIPMGEVSEKLGRGRHTTRHTELFELAGGAIVADTPGFSSFDLTRMSLQSAGELAECFTDLRPYISGCYFTGCSHRSEKGCAVLEALRAGKIEQSRHRSYVRLYDELSSVPDWEKNSVK